MACLGRFVVTSFLAVTVAGSAGSAAAAAEDVDGQHLMRQEWYAKNNAGVLEHDGDFKHLDVAENKEDTVDAYEMLLAGPTSFIEQRRVVEGVATTPAPPTTSAEDLATCGEFLKLERSKTHRLAHELTKCFRTRRDLQLGMGLGWAFATLELAALGFLIYKQRKKALGAEEEEEEA